MSTGLAGVIPALPLYIEERFGIHDPHAVEVWTALVFGAGPLASALAGPLWGALGDRLGRKAMVVRSQLGSGLALLLMPWAPDPLSLTALRALQGLISGYVAPAMAMVSADVPLHRQGIVLARMQLSLAIGLAIGPPLGAEVAALLGREAVFWVAGAFAVLAALPVVLLTDEPKRAVGAAAPPRIVKALAGALRDRLLLTALLLILVLRIGQNMAEPFTALWVRELGPLAWIAPGEGIERAVDRTTALAFTILAVAQLLFTTSWGRLADRFGPLRCLSVLALSLAVVLWITGHATSIEAYLGLRGLAAVFMAGSMALAYAAVTRRATIERALAFALVQSSIQIGLALGPMLGGVVAQGVGLRGLWSVSAGFLAVAGLGMIWLRRSRPVGAR